MPNNGISPTNLLDEHVWVLLGRPPAVARRVHVGHLPGKRRPGKFEWRARNREGRIGVDSGVSKGFSGVLEAIFGGFRGDFWGFSPSPRFVVGRILIASKNWGWKDRSLFWTSLSESSWSCDLT